MPLTPSGHVSVLHALRHFAPLRRPGNVLLATLLVFAVYACSTPRATRAPSPAPVSTAANGLAALVVPFVGTDDSRSSSTEGGIGTSARWGVTFPGAAAPFGMVQFSPDTANAMPAGYYYRDDTITAFSLTHLNGAGCSGERDFPIFPFATRPDFSLPFEDRFAHADEKASPGFYEVKLASGIMVDLTASARTGLARFTFPEGADAHLTISGATARDLLTAFDSDAKIVGNDLVTGSRTAGGFCSTNSRYHVYFAARFDRPFDGFGTVSGSDATNGAREISGKQSAVFLRFATDRTRVVQMRVGLSYVSVEHALANLDAEAARSAAPADSPSDFDAMHAATNARWNDYLGRVRLEGGDDDAQRAFYTALYHVFLQPAVASDVDGSFMGFDGKVGTDPAHPRYANFSGWDVYRSWIQLVALLAPTEASDVVRSLIASGNECGALPRWSLGSDETGVMVGDPSDPTIAGAWSFGARDFDVDAALSLMRKGATDPSAKCNVYRARPGLADYLARGFCPVDGVDPPAGSVSTTLEYAVADFAIAQLAKASGADGSVFLERARSWRNLFNKEAAGGGLSGYMEPRRRDDVAGQPSFKHAEPGSSDGFVEGNAAQYTFFVPHDAYALIDALGGDAATVARLDALFTEINAGPQLPNFWIGNEPQFGTPWLYTFAGAPDRTQTVVRRVLRESFSLAPGGLPGNDDLGATSSWQVWAMLGLYPAIPGTGVLVLGSPLFPKATLSLPSGAQLVVTGDGASADAPYVQSLQIGGAKTTRTYVTWDEIRAGSTLDFTLGATPGTSSPTSKADRPPSFYP